MQACKKNPKENYGGFVQNEVSLSKETEGNM